MKSTRTPTPRVVVRTLRDSLPITIKTPSERAESGEDQE